MFVFILTMIVGFNYRLGGDKSNDESQRSHFPVVVMKTSRKYLCIVGMVSDC